MQCLPETALENRYLEPSIYDNKTTIMFAASFTYDFHTKLILIRQKTKCKQESTTRDQLGINLVQYCQEIYTPHFLPLYKLLGRTDNYIEIVENNSRVHYTHYSRRYQVLQGLIQILWVFWSPDMNHIKNV